ncbi:hypothetical protein PR048_019223, partial [Dryococelus australis]
ILCGCYDNTLHIWTTKGKHNLTIPGHSGPIKAIAWISLDESTGTFVSASHDQTAMLWEWNVRSNEVECVHVCRGHERGLECVGVNSSGALMATGSWDTMLKIWPADPLQRSRASSSILAGAAGRSILPLLLAVDPRAGQLSVGHYTIVLAGSSTRHCHRYRCSSLQAVNPHDPVILSEWVDPPLCLPCPGQQAPNVHTRRISGEVPFFAVCSSHPLLATSLAAIRETHPAEGESSAKRLKTDHGKYQVRTPVMTLSGHKEAVSAVTWTDIGELCTASWDHTLRLWDAETGGLKSDMVGNKPFFDADWSPFCKLLVTASADRHIRLYDPRSKEGSLVKLTCTSHTQWVQSVRWSTTDEYHFLSGAYDQTVKFWDTRSPKAALYDLSGHEDKVLCCDWSEPELMVSGGADNTVRIFRAVHVTSK